MVVQQFAGPFGNVETKLVLTKKIITNPLAVMIHVCSFLTYWAGLYNSETQGKILEGVQALLVCASKMMANQPTAPARARLLPPDSDEPSDDEEAG